MSFINQTKKEFSKENCILFVLMYAGLYKDYDLSM